MPFKPFGKIVGKEGKVRSSKRPLFTRRLSANSCSLVRFTRFQERPCLYSYGKPDSDLLKVQTEACRDSIWATTNCKACRLRVGALVIRGGQVLVSMDTVEIFPNSIVKIWELEQGRRLLYANFCNLGFTS